MNTKKPRVGGEIDAYCTKCRMDLNHRIIAMVGEDVKRVECLTCHGDHNYRRPAAERDKEKERKAATREARGDAPAKSSTSKAAPRTERSARATWERAIAGQPPAAFRGYSIKGNYSTGDLIRHSKFGDGVIARVLDAQKVEILFEDGPRTMAQNVAQ